MANRPSIPDGFLGAQPKFSEVKLQTDSHKDAEFKVGHDNNVVVKLKAGQPVKVVTKLVQLPSDKEWQGYVLAQRKDKDEVRFHVGFPEKGWYKFMIFALEESDTQESLPNVYNYLIDATDIKKPATPYPMVYTKFYKECCYLDEPMVINPDLDNLMKLKFELKVPGAEKVALHCVEEWFHFEKKGGEWEGTADLTKYKGKGNKAKVMANYDKDGSTYNALLEYTI